MSVGGHAFTLYELLEWVCWLLSRSLQLNRSHRLTAEHRSKVKTFGDSLRPGSGSQSTCTTSQCSTSENRLEEIYETHFNNTFRNLTEKLTNQSRIPSRCHT